MLIEDWGNVIDITSNLKKNQCMRNIGIGMISYQRIKSFLCIMKME